MLRIREYLAHRLIGTALEPPARSARQLWYRMRCTHPTVLRDAALEDQHIHQMMQHVIHTHANCIDIGAHLGSVLAQMRCLAPQGKHIAIEPTDYKAHWLRQRYPDVWVHQLALSDYAGEASFFENTVASGYNTLRSRNTGASERVRSVKCARLDDLIEPAHHIDFIKIDVEGGEVPALRGGRSAIERSRPVILFECTRAGLRSFDISPEQAHTFFTSLPDYGIYIVNDWLHGRDPLSCPDFTQALQYPFRARNFLAAPRETACA